MIGAAKTPDIAANVACVRERVARAAERAGREPEEIRLIAVSKRFGAEAVRAAIAAGVSDIGENYVQEAAAKRGEVAETARWHLVGHLQRNKAGKAAEIFDVVQTVVGTRIAHALGRSGWSVLFFHYRGAWGSEGAFSFRNVIGDVKAAVSNPATGATGPLVAT